MGSSRAGPADHCRQPAIPRRRAAGFTLLEVIVAFSVAALVLGLTPIAYDRLMESTRYRSTVRSLLTGLIAARQSAEQTGRSAAFSVDLDNRVFGPEGKLTGALPESVDVRLVLAGSESAVRGGSIRFYPNGGSTGGSVDVLRRSGAGVRLRVDWLLGTVTQEPVTR